MELDVKELLKKTKKKKIEVRPLNNTAIFEKEIEAEIKKMILTIGVRFKNQVLKKLHMKTVKKFTDAQEGNFAKVFTSLTVAAKRKMLKEFDNKKIENLIKDIFKRIDNSNQSAFYRSVERNIGINVKDIIKTDGLNTFKNASSLKTSLFIQSLRDKAISDLSDNTLRLMTAGQSLDTLYKEVENITGKNANKSKLVARQELTVFNSQLNKARANNLGLKKRVWNAVGGSGGSKRTRPCHTKRHGKSYDVGGKLYSSCDGKSIEVGEEINCRCWDTFIVILEEKENKK